MSPRAKRESKRPISLLSCISKIMERMVLARLKYKMGHRFHLLFGFEAGVSCNDITATVSAIASHRQISKGKPSAIFIDLEKAFDLANKTPILLGLIKKGVKGTLFAWLNDYLTNRKAKVRFQGYLSSTHKLQNGTPQSSVHAI